MKVKIQKNKLDKLMYNYIDDLFENNELGELNYTYFDDDGIERDWRIIFYFGDYGDENNAFTWITKEMYEYWDEMFPDNGCPGCPQIRIEPDLKNKLNSMFNDMWEPVFKKWLKISYNLEPKTIV